MNHEETLLDVTGMTCGSCVRHVGDALRAVPGVLAVEVDLRAGRVRVRHTAGSAVPERLVQAVVQVGYGASARAHA